MRPSSLPARLRLALLYAVMFLALGTLLIALTQLVTRAEVVGHVSAAAPRPFAPFAPGPVVVHPVSTNVGHLLAASWVVILLTALVSVPFGWFASGRMLRPVREITERARTISVGSLDQRLRLTGPNDEFKQLGDTLDELLGRLQASFEAQRRFVANASHELLTPLTVERTLLQVSLANPDASAAELRQTCEELLAAGRDQERLVEAMLVLAQSEQGLAYREAVELAATTAKVLQQPRPEIEAEHLELDINLQEARIEGDAALVERLIANLVDNAVQHNVFGGLVQIRTGSGAEGGFVSVANSGVMIATGEIDVLFEPFRRLGQPRIVAGAGRHGLGLSIVRAIATAHGATVRTVPRDGGGLNVTVSFPTPPEESGAQAA